MTSGSESVGNEVAEVILRFVHMGEAAKVPTSRDGCLMERCETGAVSYVSFSFTPRQHCEVFEVMP